jgi:hypothetical protein
MKFIIFISFFISVLLVQAQTTTNSTGSGNFNASATWTSPKDLTGTNNILTGHTVTIPARNNVYSNKIIFNGSAKIAFSAFVNPWTLSGTNTYNTTGNVGIGNSAPSTTLDVTGNVNVTGKINIGDPTGSVATKAAALVARGVDVTLGNLKVRFSATGNMSIQVSTVSGTYSVYGSQVLVSGAVAYSTIDGSSPIAVTTTPTYLNSGNNFVGAGQTCTWNIMDTSAGMSWRITMIIGLGYNNNFISIERLL